MPRYIFYSCLCFTSTLLFARLGGDFWYFAVFWSLPGIACLVVAVLEYQDASGQRRRLKHRKKLITSSGLSEADWNAREIANRAMRSEKLHNTDRFYHLYLAGIRQHDAERIDAYLQKLADSYLHLFDGMPNVKVMVVDKDPQRPHDEKYNATGGHGIVKVRKDYFDGTSFSSLVHTIKHEMTHCWVDWKGIQMSDPHGPEFQRKLAEVS
ncbi:MAG TPA: hypothetical protein VN843_05745 [Anaerolineales bacterium]|nr:hypothetical protein [Anaerolineales bacterium]